MAVVRITRGMFFMPQYPILHTYMLHADINNSGFAEIEAAAGLSPHLSAPSVHLLFIPVLLIALS